MSNYHITQEQASNLLDDLHIAGLIASSSLDIDDFSIAVNAALDKVLGEPNYYGLTRDHTWLSISHEQYIKLKPTMRMVCYAPKELT